ncbi:hypothetical protein PR048_024889 [Dryococelus australis]|uniref:Uncharacterized protein n=1 Tax=Dryococelus australis TaxID=614101 RepID=A0ABQ9GPY3_9NEOP|nr:hypothetical protein PR048_024889 [Dryococelus australis]
MNWKARCMPVPFNRQAKYRRLGKSARTHKLCNKASNILQECFLKLRCLISRPQGGENKKTVHLKCKTTAKLCRVQSPQAAFSADVGAGGYCLKTSRSNNAEACELVPSQSSSLPNVHSLANLFHTFPPPSTNHILQCARISSSDTSYMSRAACSHDRHQHTSRYPLVSGRVPVRGYILYFTLGSQPSVVFVSLPSVSPPSVGFSVRQLKATHNSPPSVDSSGQKIDNYFCIDLSWRSRLVRHRSGVREALGSSPGQDRDCKNELSLLQHYNAPVGSTALIASSAVRFTEHPSAVRKQMKPDVIISGAEIRHDSRLDSKGELNVRKEGGKEQELSANNDTVRRVTEVKLHITVSSHALDTGMDNLRSEIKRTVGLRAKGCSRMSEEISTALNIEILRADEGERDLRENPPTNGIIRHDSHMRKSGSDIGPRLNPVGSGGEVQFPPPFHSGDAPYSPQSPSSTLKTSLFKSRPNLFTHSNRTRQQIPVTCQLHVGTSPITALWKNTECAQRYILSRAFKRAQLTVNRLYMCEGTAGNWKMRGTQLHRYFDAIGTVSCSNLRTQRTCVSQDVRTTHNRRCTCRVSRRKDDAQETLHVSCSQTRGTPRRGGGRGEFADRRREIYGFLLSSLKFPLSCSVVGGWFVGGRTSLRAFLQCSVREHSVTGSAIRHRMRPTRWGHNVARRGVYDPRTLRLELHIQLNIARRKGEVTLRSLPRRNHKNTVARSALVFQSQLVDNLLCAIWCFPVAYGELLQGKLALAVCCTLLLATLHFHY